MIRIKIKHIGIANILKYVVYGRCSAIFHGFPALFFLITAGFLSACGVTYRAAEKTFVEFSNSGLWHIGRHGKLSALEENWVDIAWSYFENNYNASTGFVNSTDRYPVVSMWHVADYIAALYCAQKLELIEPKEFDERFSKLLHQLNTMGLAFNKLPNVLYNAETGQMVNYANQPEEIGWAIIDIGRLLFWLHVIKAEVPEFSEYIDRVVLRFSYCDAFGENGELFSAQKHRDELVSIKENGIGYKDYAQIGMRLWGISTSSRYFFDPKHKVNILGVEFSYDSDFARRQGTYGGVFSTPYLLGGLETHWKMPAYFDAQKQDGDYFKNTAEKIYEVQDRRYQSLGITTARTDHQLGRPPFYLQDSIYAGGYAWSSLSENGENFPNLALVSTRAVFGLWALWKTPYTDHLMEVIHEVYDKNRGWYEGRYEENADYERTITITTNAMVLEALTYKVYGRLFDVPQRNQYVLQKLSNQFSPLNSCLPQLGK